MYRMQINKTVAWCFPTICVLLLSAGAAQLQASEDITGNWEFKMDFAQHQMTATASFAKAEDGTYTGTWVPQMPQQPEGETVEGEKPQLKIELKDINFEDGVLKFIQKGQFGDNEFENTCKMTLKDGKLQGILTGERGEATVVATRIKPPASPLGEWNLKQEVKDLQVKEKLIISKSELGSLIAESESDVNDDVISDVKFEDGKLSFMRTCKKDGNDVQMSFEGIITSNMLAGKYTSEAGQWDVAGIRICPELIGKWELKTDTESGIKTAVLTINDDMTGTYQMPDAEALPLKELNYDQGKLNFMIEMKNADEQPVEMNFKGEYHDNIINGELTTAEGASEIAGIKIAADAEEAEAAEVSAEAEEAEAAEAPADAEEAEPSDTASEN